MTTRQIPEARKLEALRLQTDRQLLVLILRRLDRGRIAVGRLKRGADESYEEVIGACEEIARLLPLVESISGSERARIRLRLAELEDALAVGGMRAAS